VSLEIIWMGCGMPTCFRDFLRPHPAIFDESVVHIRLREVRQVAPHDRRNRIDHVAQFRFLCSDHRFRLTLLRDVGNRSHEFEMSAGVSRLASGHADVLDGTIGQLQPMLEIEAFAIQWCSSMCCCTSVRSSG